LQRAGGRCEPVGMPGEVRPEGVVPNGSRHGRVKPVTAQEGALPAKKGGNAGAKPLVPYRRGGGFNFLKSFKFRLQISN